MESRSLSPSKIRKVPSPVVGFRVWRIIDGKVYPLNTNFGEWTPGINVAACKKGHLHQPAAVECECGFWIKDSMGGALPYYEGSVGYILGVAMGWGKVQRHLDGWRCEFASPLALSIRDDFDVYPTTGEVKAIGMRFDTPILHGIDNLMTWYLDNTVKGE